MPYCGSIIRLSIVDVTVISDIYSLCCGLVICKLTYIAMYACTHGQGLVFISLSSSRAGHVMYDV